MEARFYQVQSHTIAITANPKLNHSTLNESAINPGHFTILFMDNAINIITLQGVTNLLSSYSRHKSPGPDNLHAAFLKQVSMEIVPD